MELSELRWDAAGLVTVAVQDRFSGELRMVAHANREAIERTLTSGLAHFYSRSRQALWCKGMTSGNTIAVSAIYADCDGDALIYLADPMGPSCHTGQRNCFFRPVTPSDRAPSVPQGLACPTLEALWDTLGARRDAGNGRSYTRRLLELGPTEIAAKVQEEADEYGAALRGESDERVLSEAADVMYHLLVGLLARGLTFRQVEAELAGRFGVSGIDEKASRTSTP